MYLRKIQIFAGKNKDLAIHVFFIQEKSSLISINTLDIIFPGLPQTPIFSDMQKMVTKTHAVAYVHYYGSWYSGGIFLPSTVMDSVSDAIKIFKKGLIVDVYTEEKIQFVIKNIVLVGNSFGGYFVYQSEEKLKKILLAPFLPYGLSENNNIIQIVSTEVESNLNAYKKSLPYCYRGITSLVWENFTKPNKNFNLKHKNITIYIGNKDKLITKDYIYTTLKDTIKKNVIEIDDCGHDFLKLYKAYFNDSK